MARRRIKPQKPLQSAFSFRPSQVRDLFSIDQKPLLEALRKRCQQVATEMEDAKRELQTFKTVWQPAFTRWLHERFGKELTRVREIEARIHELEELIQAVESASMLSGDSLRTTYARLERERREERELEEMRARHAERQSDKVHGAGSSSSTADDDLSPEVEARLRQEFADFFSDMDLDPAEAKRLFEEFKQSFREDVLEQESQESPEEEEADRDPDEDFEQSHRERPEKRRAPTPQNTSRDQRIKQIYRDLARRLHPDVNTQVTSREKELWFEVQAAYDSKNLDQLETLAAIIEGGGEDSATGYLKVESLSRLMAILKDFQNKLKSARNAIRESKQHPAWNFAEMERTPRRLKSLAHTIENELREATYDCQAVLASYESQIARWKAPARSKKRRPAPTSRR